MNILLIRDCFIRLETVVREGFVWLQPYDARLHVFDRSTFTFSRIKQPHQQDVKPSFFFQNALAAASTNQRIAKAVRRDGRTSIGT